MDTCIPGPGTAYLSCKRRKVRCDRSARSAGVGGPAQAPRVGGRKQGREESSDADGRSGGSKRRRRDLEGYRVVVEAEKAATLSTHVLLAQWVMELDAEIAKLDKELDSGNIQIDLHLYATNYWCCRWC